MHNFILASVRVAPGILDQRRASQSGLSMFLTPLACPKQLPKL
jgi:hypothetical protein